MIADSKGCSLGEMVVRTWGQGFGLFGGIGGKVGFGLSVLLEPVTAGGFPWLYLKLNYEGGRGMSPYHQHRPDNHCVSCFP